MKQSIKLQTDSILHVKLDIYERDFTFIVNGKEFQTSKFFAEILSPKITNIHLIDPTINEIQINTKSNGDFQKIINLQNFKEEEISDDEIDFIKEITEILNIQEIKLQLPTSEITIDNVLNLIKKHEKSQQFFNQQYSSEIEFLSAHFKEIIKSDERSKLSDLSLSTLVQVLSSSKLELNDEDELLNFINELYLKSAAYSELYEYVYFENVESKSIENFLTVFDINDLTTAAWQSISKRLLCDVKTENKRKRTEDKKEEAMKCIDIPYSNKNFEGIIDYFSKHSKIAEEVKITSSSINSGDLQKVLQPNYPTNGFHTRNESNSWICIEFIKHKIKPTNYTIRSNNWGSSYASHPKNWVIEGSNDLTQWEKLAEEKNNSVLKGESIVHTFPIQNKNDHEFKYIRILQNGTSWANNNYFCLNCIEIYGQIIQ